MRLIIWLLLLFYLLFTFSWTVQAQNSVSPTPVDYKLPFPGLLPDHPLYPLKKMRDKILYIFTADTIKKIELNLLFADKKIGMVENLIDKRKFDLASETLLESQTDLAKAASLLPLLAEHNSLPPGLSDKIELAAHKHKEIMENSETILQVKNNSNNIRDAINLNNRANSEIQSLKEKENKLNN